MPKKGKNKAFDWVKKCAQSNGTSFMIPEKFQKNAEKFLKEAEDLTALKKEIVRREAGFNVMRDNFWYDLRKHLESEGVKDIFEQNIDFDLDAKKDGFLVVNIYKGQDYPMGMPRPLPNPGR